MENFPALPGASNTTRKKPKAPVVFEKTYKNAILLPPPPPPPPKVEVDIQVIESDYVPNYYYNCMDSIYHTEDRDAVNPQAILMVVEFEEQELKQLKNPSSESYKTLHETFHNAATQAKVNIVVIIGHMEKCEDYINTFTFKNFKSRLPTVVFVVGCYSNAFVGKYNKDARFKDKHFYFFGFEHLMHVIHGDIYMCVNGHQDVPVMDCRYQGSRDNLDYYLVKTINNSIPYNKIPYNNLKIQETPPKKLIQCCKAKLDRFKSAFMKDLYTRRCIKVDTDVLVKKLNGIRKKDGSLRPSSELEESDFVISMKDGVECKKDTCVIPNPYKSLEKTAQVFNDEMKVSITKRKINHELHSYEHSSVDEEKIISYIHSLKRDEIQELMYSVEHYHRDYQQPYFYSFFEQNLPLLQKAILTQYGIDIRKQGGSGLSILHKIIKSMNDLQSIYYSGGNNYTMSSIYRTFRRIYDTNKEIFLIPDNRGDSPLVYIFEEKLGPLFAFYIRYFSPDTHDYNKLLNREENNLPDLIIQFLKPLPHELRLIIFSLILYCKINLSEISNGKHFVTELIQLFLVEFLQKDSHLVQDYLELLYVNTNSPELIEFAERKRDEYTNYQLNPVAKGKHLKDLQSEARKYRREYERKANRHNNYSYYNSDEEDDEMHAAYDLYSKYSKMVAYYETYLNNHVDLFTNLVAITKLPADQKAPMIITKEKADSIVNKILEKYEQGYKAITRIKTYFSDIQKYLKKNKSVPEKAKVELYQELNEISKDEKYHMDDAGEDAIARLGMMAATFSGFKKQFGLDVNISNQLGGKRTRREARRNRRLTRKH